MSEIESKEQYDLRVKLLRYHRQYNSRHLKGLPLSVYIDERLDAIAAVQRPEAVQEALDSWWQVPWLTESQYDEILGDLV